MTRKVPAAQRALRPLTSAPTADGRPADGRASAAPSGVPAEREAFGRVLDEHRRDLVLLCYRFLGSLSEAEEAAQETALRAWRARSSFRGDSSVRTWLHRIATRICLDELDHARRRVLPWGLMAAADSEAPPDLRPVDVPWLEPLPDEFLVDAELDPAARYSLRESVSLAFLAALQELPARQRAVLLLRDVLAWSAVEVAEALEMTVSAVTSALHRARTTLHEGPHRRGLAATPAAWPDDPAIRRLLDAYVRAWETDDVAGLLAALRADVRLAMPPSTAWYSGAAEVVAFLRRSVLPQGPFRLRPTAANGQPAFLLLATPSDGTAVLLGVHVLDVGPAGIADIVAFMSPEIGRRFAPLDGQPIDTTR